MYNNFGSYPSYPYGGSPSPYNGYTPSPAYSQQNSHMSTAGINTNKIYATGIEDVRSRYIPANSDYIFLDNDKPLIYRKTTDATGKMDIQVFKISPYVEEEKPKTEIDLSKFVPIDRFEALEKQFKELKDSLGG